MRKFRDREEILTKFPWVNFVRWGICGAVGLPVASIVLYIILQFVFWISKGASFENTLQGMLSDGSIRTSLTYYYQPRGQLFMNLTGLPFTHFVWVAIWLMLPGGIVGCLLYLWFRNREIDLVKQLPD